MIAMRTLLSIRVRWHLVSLGAVTLGGSAKVSMRVLLMGLVAKVVVVMDIAGVNG